MFYSYLYSTSVILFYSCEMLWAVVLNINITEDVLQWPVCLQTAPLNVENLNFISRL